MPEAGAGTLRRVAVGEKLARGRRRRGELGLDRCIQLLGMLDEFGKRLEIGRSRVVTASTGAPSSAATSRTASMAPGAMRWPTPTLATARVPWPGFLAHAPRARRGRSSRSVGRTMGSRAYWSCSFAFGRASSATPSSARTCRARSDSNSRRRSPRRHAPREPSQSRPDPEPVRGAADGASRRRASRGGAESQLRWRPREPRRR